MSISQKIITAAEAAAMIRHGDNIGFSGFTAAGACKVIPGALALRAEQEHAAGRQFQLGILTGASTGPSLDGALAKAEAIAWRTPYQSDADLRKRINKGTVKFFDMHLSLLPQYVRYGFLGPIDWAIVEACDVTDNGEIILTSSVGASPTFLTRAKRILVEVNAAHPRALRGLHDIYEPADPPLRREIPIYSTSDRIGTPYVKVDPSRIAGIVLTDRRDETGKFDEVSDVTRRIGENVANFLAAEVRRGTIPNGFLPIQSGVGDIANAVLGAMGANADIPPFEMYTEVAQDAVIGLVKSGKVKFVSSCALTVSGELLDEIYGNLDFFRPRMVLRPQEITNNPEVVRRLGIVSINTAIEVDLFGNVNSTHVMGKSLMNGIGGSGDFTRNAFISIFTCPSLQKGGKISTVVPLVSHMDHSEHSVQVLVTDQGVADLRGKSPTERARLITDVCAHPSFRDQLHGYFDRVQDGQTPQTLAMAFAMHEQFLRTGDMRGVVWEQRELIGA